jgi:hypothetical protein
VYQLAPSCRQQRGPCISLRRRNSLTFASALTTKYSNDIVCKTDVDEAPFLQLVAEFSPISRVVCQPRYFIQSCDSGVTRACKRPTYVNFFSSLTIWMRPVKSSPAAWLEMAPFVPFGSEPFNRPAVGDNGLVTDAVLARTGDVER